MTDPKLDPEHAVRVARELLTETTERRVTAVRTLVGATNAVDAAEQALKDARDAHARAWADAITSGWSDKELRATGVRPPLKTGTPPKTRRTPRNTAPSPDEASE
ncbi:hypothetical protein B7R21_18435 [Subtercola boreus]|uniref:Uncharacterized protein n=1 Tax=Subtercola boreus TaxID=120213 RepID=A0A3E0VA86_9MICO|nr:hypothetical protein [Subtercola boreus]RFA06756.1 hypothetical protein B7R21_18435 [Subtercola boreus]